MKRYFLKIAVTVTMLIASWSASAISLMQVYQQALFSDPTFKSAQAQYLATKENVPIARAALLPNLALTGSSLRQHINQPTNAGFVTQTTSGSFIPLETNFYNTFNNYILNVSQPIFNAAAWAQLSDATFQVKAAEANFAAAAQDLMLRTASA